MSRLSVALAMFGVIALIGCGGGADTPKANKRVPKQKAETKEQTKGPAQGAGDSPGSRPSGDDLTPEQRAELEKVLSEGPSEDECKIPSHRKPYLEKLGPILPAVPYRKMRPFLPKKLGVFSRDEVLPMPAMGFPSLRAMYHADVGGEKQTVFLTVRDNRQANGGSDAHLMETMLKKIREKAGPDRIEKRNVGQFTIYIQPNSIICAIAGRFGVFVDARGKSEREIGLEFLKGIDLEKLSKTK